MRAYTSGGHDGFVAKIDTDGALTWNTFLGGSGSDDAIDSKPAIDNDGNVYVGGWSNATWGTPVRAYTTSSYDGLAAKLDSNGALIWHTFLGGSDEDAFYGIEVDISGNVYVGGYSYATWGSPVRAYTSDYDGAAVRLDSNGVLIWNMFLGGSGSDEVVYPLTVDTSGNIYAGGYSNATWGSPVQAFTPGYDGFVAKIANDITAPTAAITYSSSGPYSAGDIITITATFSEPMADSPVPQISISGSGTLAATDMTKISTTVYSYAFTVAAGSGTATIAMSTGTDTNANIITSAPTSGATFTVTPRIVTVVPVAVEIAETAAVIQHGGGRGSSSPGRGGTAPMIDLKTMQVISTSTSPYNVVLPASPSGQQSSPTVILLQKKRNQIIEKIEKQIKAAKSDQQKKILKQKMKRQLKSIDMRIRSLSKNGR